MEGILSGFPFSRKKEFAAHDSNNKPGNVDPKHADDPKHVDPTRAIAHDVANDTNRSNSMRLTKNDPAPDFDNDSIADFGFGNQQGGNDSGRVTDIMRKAPPTAVIGPKISFKGELTGEEDLLIQGRVEGSIDLKGNHLTIGSQGVIKADVAAKTITVEGTVEGDIVASDHIAIKSASRVKGNLKAERVTLEDGAKFRGSIDMEMDAENKMDNKKPLPSSSAPLTPDSKTDEFK